MKKIVNILYSRYLQSTHLTTRGGIQRTCPSLVTTSHGESIAMSAEKRPVASLNRKMSGVHT